MISELFLKDLSLWGFVWQSTLFAVIGLTGSFLLRRRPARASQVLFLAMVAAVLVPAMSVLVKHFELGLFTEEPISLPSVVKDIPMEASVVSASSETQTEEYEGVTDLELIEAGSGGANIPWRPIVLYGWMIVILILLGRLFAAFFSGVCLLRRAQSRGCEQIQRVADCARARLGITKGLQVRSSKDVHSPVIWCWSPTSVLLVPGDLDDRVDWEGVISHELAHWRRWDHISGLIAELIVCILSWNPLLWWSKKQMVRLSEQACDDWVVAGGRPCEDYAQSLLDFKPQKQAAFVPAVVHSKRGLAGRVRRILKDNCGNPRVGVGWALVVNVVVVCLMGGVAFAQTRPSRPTGTVKTKVGRSALLIAAGGNDNDTKTKPDSAGVVATLKSLGAHGVELDDDGEVVAVGLNYVKTLTDADLKHLTGLKKLRRLKLGRTNITDAGLAHLKGLTSLEGITLTETQVTDAGLVHLKGLTNLYSLWLTKTRVTDTGVEQLKGLTKLIVLMLGGTQITDAGVEHLKALPNLEQLMLGGTKVTDVGLEHLKSLSNLKYLSLDGTQVTDASVANLEELTEKNLKWIDIGDSVTDATLEQLARLTNLEKLTLTSRITDSGLKHLGRMTHLKSLWLYLKDAQITDAGLVHLEGLTNLNVLQLSGTKISDAGLAHLKKLSNLEYLHLNDTKITDSGLAYLKGLTNLYTLWLQGTRVTDSGMVHLKGMTKLRTLNLSGTKISDAGLGHLKGLTSLKYLDLKGTSVTDKGVNDLKQALSKCTIAFP